MNVMDLFEKSNDTYLANEAEMSAEVLNYNPETDTLEADICLAGLRLTIHYQIESTENGLDILAFWPLWPMSDKEGGFEHVVKYLDIVNSTLENCALSIYGENVLIVLTMNIPQISPEMTINSENMKSISNIFSQAVDVCSNVYEKYGKGLIYFSLGGTSVETALAQCNEDD